MLFLFNKPLIPHHLPMNWTNNFIKSRNLQAILNTIDPSRPMTYITLIIFLLKSPILFTSILLLFLQTPSSYYLTLIISYLDYCNDLLINFTIVIISHSLSETLLQGLNWSCHTLAQNPLKTAYIKSLTPWLPLATFLSSTKSKSYLCLASNPSAQDGSAT